MSWFVFTEGELQNISDQGYLGLADDLRAKGRWTDDDTLLVEPRGPEATLLVGAFEKYPRRMARDPPINTLPSDEKQERYNL
jgi:hypothetical protein